MTAEVIDLFPTGSSADDTVRATIKALMKGKDISAEELAPRLGMSASSLYRRLAAKGSKEAFKAGEVATAAHYLGVNVGDLYSGLGGAFVPPSPPDGGSFAGTPGSSTQLDSPTSSYAGSLRIVAA